MRINARLGTASFAAQDMTPRFLSRVTAVQQQARRPRLGVPAAI